MGQGESAETVDLKVFLGTWNLGMAAFVENFALASMAYKRSHGAIGNTTPPEDLSWIPNKEQYDIYAIGVQGALYYVACARALTVVHKSVSMRRVKALLTQNKTGFSLYIGILAKIRYHHNRDTCQFGPCCVAAF